MIYRLTKPNHEVGHLFDAVVGQVGNTWPGEVYPGRPGLVFAHGELRSMTRGFPLVLKGKKPPHRKVRGLLHSRQGLPASRRVWKSRRDECPAHPPA